MATVTFKKGSFFSSEQFNQRFIDLLGGSILKGFYLSKGSASFNVNVGSGVDDGNVLITSEGVRIEQPTNIDNALTIEPNNSEMVRIDAVYVRYENIVNNDSFDFAVQQGEPGGELPYFLSNDLHTLIGFVIVPTNGAALAEGMFEHPSRGVKLGRMAGEVVFQEEVNMQGGAIAPEPQVDSAIATKGYVDRTINDNVPSYIHNDLSVEMSNYDATNFVYLKAEYERPDGTLHMTSELSELSPAGNYEQVTIRFFDESGVNQTKIELWGITYDENRTITSKKLIR